MEREPLLRVRGLGVKFHTPAGVATAVRGVSFDVYPGETLGLVGESGSGKSTTGLSVLQLLPASASVDRESRILLGGRSILQTEDKALRGMRGAAAAVIFQNPMTALNPAFTIGWQLREAVRAHRHLKRTQLDDLVVRSLREVGLPDPVRLARTYPHQMSGGMLQRVGIALSLINNPGLLIADEPTTALDVTVQAQILSLLREITSVRRTGLLLITHDLGVIARMCDRVAVMREGEIVEEAQVDNLFHRPRHPYTQSLLASYPKHRSGPPAGSN